MATFIQKLFSEYPIPKIASIWGSNGLDRQPIEDINILIESAIDEIASDVLLTGHIEATGMSTKMPEGTVCVDSAQLTAAFPFQGNRLVKHTFVPAHNVCYLRYYPAVITYKRKLTIADLDTLAGDRLIFFKSYVLWKMAEKELSILQAQNMNVDNGQIDLSVLDKFVTRMYERYNKLKEDSILLYSATT